MLPILAHEIMNPQMALMDVGTTLCICLPFAVISLIAIPLAERGRNIVALICGGISLLTGVVIAWQMLSGYKVDLGQFFCTTVCAGPFFLCGIITAIIVLMRKKRQI